MDDGKSFFKQESTTNISKYCKACLVYVFGELVKITLVFIIYVFTRFFSHLQSMKHVQLVGPNVVFLSFNFWLGQKKISMFLNFVEFLAAYWSHLSCNCAASGCMLNK